MEIKNIVVIAIGAMCCVLYLSQYSHMRIINDLESIVGTQRIQLHNQEIEIKSLNDQIDALNIKVDNLPK